MFTVALIACCPLQTRADTIRFSVSGGTDLLIGSDSTAGYAFTVSSPILVTNLGLFDFGNDRLGSSHAVTIWTSTGSQLVQATIPAGTGGTLIDGFRYLSIAPILLNPGTYTIGGFYANSNTDFMLADASITNASGLSYVGSRSAVGFTFPSDNVFLASNGFFGPNFQFTTVATPDSGSTVSLLGCALLGLAALRRKLSC